MRRNVVHRLRARPLIQLATATLMFAIAVPTLHAQTLRTAATFHGDLPNAPSSLQSAQALPASALLAGSVTDLSGALVSGALIRLEAEPAASTPLHSTHSDSAGHFSFSGLAAGAYHLSIFAPGLQSYLSASLSLAPGERLELPTIALAVADASVYVTVAGNSPEVADAEIEQQVRQRTLGIFPNFYTSYVWNAAPLSATQKYRLTFHVLADPVSLIGFALTAEIETNADTFPQWGRDAPSYGKRFGAAFGDSLFSRGFDSAVFPAIFHQDPRYFYMGPAQPVRKRLLHALSNGIICRGDNGRPEPNYSHFVGNLSAGALSSVYHPASDSAGKLAIDNAALRLGFDGLDATLREFVFSHITRHKPPYANGEPANEP